MPFSSLCIIVCFATCFLVLVTQSCLTLCNPMNCIPPDSSVSGILQARILKWVVISYSRGSFQPRDLTGVSYTAAVSLPSESLGKSLRYPYPSSKIQVNTGKWRDLFSSDMRGKSSMMLCKNKLTWKTLWILEWKFFTNEDQMFYKD